MDIEKVITQMTLEEKASLLSGGDFWHTKAVERLGIPATMVSDGPHGLRKQDQEGDHLGINESIKAVCFPAASAGAASFDRELLEQMGEAMGDACQHEEVSVLLGPAVNIKRSPLCGRNFEYFSEDPYLTGELAAALIHGVQSRNIGTSIKHFAANSQEHRRMSSDAVIDERTLREIYLPAFEKAVKQEQPWTVMCSYNRLNGEYASQNRWLLTDLLRGEWGFKGYVMSDWGAVSDRVKGVAAGLDLEMPSSGGTNDRRIVEAVRSGALEESCVDESVRRILRIVDRYLANRAPQTSWDKEMQHALSGKLAAECMVLLKNEDQVLPLRRGESVAVIGKFAAQPRFQGGGSSHINCFRVESLMDALQGMPGIIYAQGYDVETEKPDEALIAEAVRAAEQADKAVIVAGLPDLFESEGYDRTHMRMPICQVELITRVASVNPNTIVVLYNGSPVEMPWAERVKGIVEAYLGGQAVGAATKAILWGDANPSGRLPETFPMQLEDNPSYLTYGGEGNTAVYSEGIFVGYRYYDKKKMQVRYPFGYGLSYTSFVYSNLQLSAECFTDAGRELLNVSVDVTNTGSMAGKEVVQLYVAAPAPDLTRDTIRPVRELKGIEKIFLEPGETKTVHFALDARAFAYWNTRIHDWFVESGSYTIQIGKSSRDIVLCKEVQVTGTKKDALPALDPDTIFMDLEKYPGAMELFGGLMQSAMGALGSDEPDGDEAEKAAAKGSAGQTSGGTQKKEEEKSAAKEAITDEMNAAMMRYMPLRGIVSFSSGAVSYDRLAEMARKYNELNN